MNVLDSPFRRLGVCLLVAWLTAGPAGRALAQPALTDEERLQILLEPDAIRKKIQRDKNRPPFEFFRSQVAPFDVLPYAKANHWTTLSFELRANDDDYKGSLQTDPVMLLGLPQEVIFRCDARLLKEQRARRGLQMMVPASNGQVPKEWSVALLRPGALRPDATWQATLSTLPPHQMLVLVLSKDATNKFAAWGRMAATIPSEVERDGGDVEKLRYYRLVLPMDSDKPALSSHPLTWTTISHVIWDGYAPDSLSVSQQEAMLDWLHWGGQLIVSGGAGQPYSLYSEPSCFLAKYLPADAAGETVPLSQEDLLPLSKSYPPPRYRPNAEDQPQQSLPKTVEGARQYARNYQGPVPIRPAPKRPVQLSVLRARPGASTISLGEASTHLLAVEGRVGRGRITMLALNPNEEALLAWPGLDTLIRRVILRRPEEPIGDWSGADGYLNQPARGRLLAPDLSWYRIASRDTGSDTGLPTALKSSAETGRVSQNERGNNQEAEEAYLNQLQGVADWRDSARLPRLSRDLLEQASGITIPSSQFVLKVILAYLLAVVPLNWLICRFVLNRREWAWVVVPVVALCFAAGVERLAARDIGYDTASDEIDLLEIQGDYPRAHLTRLASLYTTGGSRFAISYPKHPTALALPLDNGRSIRGEEISTATFQSSPVPALTDFLVQPRSLSMFRAEQMLTLMGAIRLEGEGSDRRLVNESEFDLRDAILIDSGGTVETDERWLGAIKAGASVTVGGTAGQAPPARVDFGPGPDPNPFLEALRASWEPRPENQGELRLVAWVAAPIGGQVIVPAIDRRRGFTAVLVHLRSGSPPSPDGRRYNLLARGSPAVDSRLDKEIEAARAASQDPAGQRPARTRRTRQPGRPLLK
ncbi:MAG: hypothetical protein ACHRXM_09815 [Isosphaerales bacterium]